jgi:ParB family chromosome partitioning protein
MMGRKNLFESVLQPKSDTGESAPAAPPSRSLQGLGGSRGAVGAVSQSIQQMKAQSVLELAPDLIDPSFINDRLDGGAEGHAELVELIRQHGQQVPILVRPHPEASGRFQIVYGRRRLKAAIELGRTVRAVVKPLTDDQLVVAQGQENSARADLSFIERALFAAALEERGFGRDTIMASLAVDKSGLSRLISSAVRIPRDIIDAIGPAPKTGRDRWIELAGALEDKKAVTAARRAISEKAFAARPSDERFAALLSTTKEKPKLKRAVAAEIKASDGAVIGTVARDRRATTLKIDDKAAPAFGAYLAEQIPEIYAAWKAREDA